MHNSNKLGFLSITHSIEVKEKYPMISLWIKQSTWILNDESVPRSQPGTSNPSSQEHSESTEDGKDNDNQNI